jgi:hypothetical protein
MTFERPVWALSFTSLCCRIVLSQLTSVGLLEGLGAAYRGTLALPLSPENSLSPNSSASSAIRSQLAASFNMVSRDRRS